MDVKIVDFIKEITISDIVGIVVCLFVLVVVLGIITAFLETKR